MGFLAILGLRLRWDIKRKIAFGNSLGFQAQIEELPLKGGAEKENPKNDVTGSTLYLCARPVNHSFLEGLLLSPDKFARQN